MRSRSFALLLVAAALCGCSGGFAPPLPGQSLVANAVRADKKLRQNVYWTLFASCSYPQIQYAAVPIKAKSKAKSYFCSAKNGLGYTSGLSIDAKGRLWVLSFTKNGGNPSEAAVFKLPLGKTSVQQYTFVLSGTSGSDAIAFDPSGNLWASSPGNSSVFEYTGPFNKSKTLTPVLTLSVPSGYKMYSIAFDKSANLYESNFDSTGTNSIGVLTPPYTGIPYFLNGLTAPGGLAFDKTGNLYAWTGGSTQALARYDHDRLKSGDTPSIVDSKGIPSASYEAAFAITAQGDLYAANCGNSGSAGIDVWPLSKKPFSSSLAPSVIYNTADVTQAGCAWGIAVK